ncbi:MAG: feruloyl-CoA synthase [Quisquiliibacterium sp.]
MIEQAQGFRPIRFGIESVQIEHCAGGEIRLSSEPALQPCAHRLSDRLLHWASQAPSRTYLAKRGPDGQWQHLSYAMALERARAIGQALLDRGLSADRPLVILSENDLEHGQLMLAALLVGVPVAPVSTAYSLISQDHEKLRHVIELLTPGLVFAANGERYARAIAAAVPPEVELVVTDAPPAGRQATRFAQLAATVPTAKVDAARQACGPDTIAKFLFTSGSTSLPKAVTTTQRMLCSNLQMILQSLPFLGEEPPVLVDWLPWAHVFGGSHNTGIALYNGGTLYIDDGKPVPGLIARTLENLREIAPTIYFNVPKGFEEIAGALRADPALARHFFSRLRMMFYAGAGLSQPVWDSLHASAEKACGARIPIGTGLGMTETAPSALFTNRLDVRSGDIGLPCAGVQVRLVPVEDKHEIRYRGPSVMPGYWRAGAANQAAFDEQGYFRSGDAVRFADAGDPQKGLVFDGRIAEDFKLATGTWVSVGPLRARAIALGDPYVQDVVITGINRDDVGALLFPQSDACRRLAGLEPGVDSLAQVLAAPAVRAFFQDLLNTLAAGATGSASRINRALLMHEAATLDSGEATDKGSINQRAVLARRAPLVEALYDDSTPDLLRPR